MAPEILTSYRWASPADAMAASEAHPTWGADDKVWTGGASMATARKWGAYGNDALVSASDALVDKYLAAMPETSRRRWGHDVAGAFPDVPRYVMGGDPRTMRRRSGRMDDRAPMRIFVDLSASSGVKAEAYAERGAAVMAFVRAAASSRPVELVACVIARNENKPPKSCSKIALWTCAIPSAPFNVSLAAAWFSHVGVYRGALVNLPGQKYGFTFSGFPLQSCHIDEGREILGLGPNDVYIPGAFYDDPIIRDPEGWIAGALKDARLTAPD